METAVALYFLLGALIVLPSTDDLEFPQLISVMTTWPIVVIYSFIKFIRKDH